MLEKIRLLSHQKLYWTLLLVLGLSLEFSALFYQYVLGEWPCVLCIHLRIWVLGFIVVAILALLVDGNQWLMRGLHLVNTGMMTGFVERSWQTLAVERGWVFGDCNMESGLPPWFALDKWFPALFEVQTACGYTPIILFNITMAEMLLAISSVLLLISVLMLIVSCCTSQE
ncbi:MAG: disulfide bond formation protein B [Gammaproteobacteria bacterium]|nr:disulfide bond formation protein B [Gammaproteobacteria bacterium]